MDIINQIILKMLGASNFTEVIEYAIENLSLVVNCRVAQCMIIKDNIINRFNLKKVCLQKEKVGGRYIDIISNTDKMLGKPAFSNLYYAKTELCNNKNISYPIISDEDELICTI